MSLDKNINKVLVIGSGPIVIGQAAEFDYSGTQACSLLKQEGIKVVLINSNPATIMTDASMADNIYIEPLTLPIIKKIIDREEPDAILAALGGQTALNLAMELSEEGILKEKGIRLLGTDVDSIKKAEDRKLFKETMESIGEPVIRSIIAEDLKEALAFAQEVGYPLIIRPAYTLGGAGGGIVNNDEELNKIVDEGIYLSRVGQVLVEKSIAGWKEVEFEVLRDKRGDSIIVCDMENLDPVGIHTGDSIVVAPSQTLKSSEHKMLSDSAKNIVDALNICGGCNVQYAFNPATSEYYIIEVNPRVSRSSALASKATGFPIAKVATMIALGYNLRAIEGDSKKTTCDTYSLNMDYTVIKIPKWPFDKFVKADSTLGTKMKATGEIMAIGRSFQEALLKATRSLEIDMDGLGILSDYIKKLKEEDIIKGLSKATDERLFLVAEAIRRGITLDIVHKHTLIDMFFLEGIYKIIKKERRVKEAGIQSLDRLLLKKAKKMGLSDTTIAKLCHVSPKDIETLRDKWGIRPKFARIRLWAGSKVNSGIYYYSTYNYDELSKMDSSQSKSIVVIGSGPIRIGQGIEFDYCSVHCLWALKRMGYKAIIINNNPETVSTDPDIPHRLFFEPLTKEDVLNVLEAEKPLGVIVQFGGQTSINLAKEIQESGYNIIGTSLESIDQAEDRKEFDGLLSDLNLLRPRGKTVFTTSDAIDSANTVGYPVLVRPSYVLGGKGMEIAYRDEDIEEYMEIINRTSQKHPVLIDKYLAGREVEIDAISDGKDILIPGIMEHIERAGVHSGDSISVYPSYSLSTKTIKRLVEYTKKLAIGLNIRGLINIQYVLYRDKVYVIEVNPRSSRTVPFLSKVTGVPMVDLATKVSLGYSLKGLGYGVGLYKNKGIFAVKVPVFSFEKLPLVDTGLGPEMKSTGEVLGVGKTLSEALYKGMLGASYVFPKKGNVLITVADQDKQEVIPIASQFADLGFKLYATSGTAIELHSNYIAANVLRPISGKGPNVGDLIRDRKIDLIINTPTKGRITKREGFKIRRMAVEHSIPCITFLDTAKVFIDSVRLGMSQEDVEIYSMDEIVRGKAHE